MLRRFNPGLGKLTVKTRTKEQYWNIVKLAKRIPNLGPLADAEAPCPGLLAAPAPVVTCTQTETRLHLRQSFNFQHFLEEKGFEQAGTRNSHVFESSNPAEVEGMKTWVSKLCQYWGFKLEDEEEGSTSNA